MWLRLRQIALVAAKLEPIEAQLESVLGIRVCYRDPGVAHFGLENALLPIGNQLLEVVAPIEEGTAGGRYLERRGGDGGYMVITQCDDHGPRRRRVEALGIRIVNHGAHDPDGPWEPAGPDWQQGRQLDRVSGIAAAEIQADDPARVAARWSEIAEIPLTTTADGHPALELDNATVRFVPCTDGRPEGLGGIDVLATNAAAIMAAARDQGLATGERQIYLCGMRIDLV
jgi:hypothetical protein